MKYILHPDIALRGFQRVPFAYYEKRVFRARKLSAEAYLLLSLCDGTREIEEGPLLNQLREWGLIREAAEGDVLSEWQKPRFCDNRYFPRANWSLTGYCNYRCKHCFMAADNDCPKTTFTREEWQKTLDDLDRCGVQAITLTGGEPTLHPDFLDIVGDICRRGMEVFDLNTNGSLINDEMLSEFRRVGADPLIKISFDCIGHHDWMRGVEGAEEQALRAIRLCKKRGFRVRVQTCIHRLNVDTLEKTARMMADLGVEEMRVIRTSEAPRWVENAGDACFGLEEYYDLMLDFTEKYAMTGCQMDIDIWQFLQFFPRLRTYHYRPVNGRAHGFRDTVPVCGGNRSMIAINSDGSLVPCNQLSGYFEKNGIVLGNVKRDDLQKLLSEGRYLDTVTCSVGRLWEANPLCRACAYRTLCAGGCRALAMVLTGDYLGIDPAKCVYFKKGYMQKIDAVFGRVAERTGIAYRNVDDVTLQGVRS